MKFQDIQTQLNMGNLEAAMDLMVNYLHRYYTDLNEMPKSEVEKFSNLLLQNPTVMGTITARLGDSNIFLLNAIVNRLKKHRKRFQKTLDLAPLQEISKFFREIKITRIQTTFHGSNTELLEFHAEIKAKLAKKQTPEAKKHLASLEQFDARILNERAIQDTVKELIDSRRILKILSNLNKLINASIHEIQEFIHCLAAINKKIAAKLIANTQIQTLLLETKLPLASLSDIYWVFKSIKHINRHTSVTLITNPTFQTVLLETKFPTASLDQIDQFIREINEIHPPTSSFLVTTLLFQKTFVDALISSPPSYRQLISYFRGIAATNKAVASKLITSPAIVTRLKDESQFQFVSLKEILWFLRGVTELNKTIAIEIISTSAIHTHLADPNKFREIFQVETDPPIWNLANASHLVTLSWYLAMLT